MRKLALIYVFIVCILIGKTTLTEAAKCIGSPLCTACKNCRYCGHCAKEGGTCGVCKPSNISKEKPPSGKY